MNTKRGGSHRGGGGANFQQRPQYSDSNGQGNRRGNQADAQTNGNGQPRPGNNPKTQGNARPGYGTNSQGYEEEKMGQHRRVQDTSLQNQSYQPKKQEEVIYDDRGNNGYRRKGGNNFNSDPQPSFQNNFNQQQNTNQKGGTYNIRGNGRGQFAGQRGPIQDQYQFGGAYDSQDQFIDPNAFQPAGKGRGRGRGVSYQGYSQQDFIPAPGGRGQSVGIISQGRGKPVYEQYDTYSTNTTYSFQQQTFISNIPPFAPFLQSQIPTPQWVGDQQRGVDHGGKYEDHVEDQVQHPISSNFRPGPPGVIRYAKQPKTRDQRATQSSAQKSHLTAIQETIFKQQQEHKNSMDDLLEEKLIQDKRNMNVCIQYKEYPIPNFFQGPQYIVYKEPSKIKNHRYPDDKEDPNEALCYDVVQFPPLQIREFPPPKPPRNDAEISPIFDVKTKKKDEPSLEDKVFDVKAERKKGKKFWKDSEAKAAKGSPTDKPFKSQKSGIKMTSLLKVKREEAAYVEYKKSGGKKGLAKTSSKDKSAQRAGSKSLKGGKKKKDRVAYEEFLQFEGEIKKGIQEGRYFEGTLRVNPNNRNRAFVSIDGVGVDVMIDGLSAQNRAFDGDSVVISLIDPSRWPPLNSTNILVDGKVFKPAGFTNETAIETRVIDKEGGQSNADDHQSSSGVNPASTSLFAIQADPEDQPRVKSASKSHGKAPITNILGETEEELPSDDIPPIEDTPTPLAEDEESSSSAESSSASSESSEDDVDKRVEKEIDDLIKRIDDKIDPDYDKYANDKVLGDSADEIIDNDEESEDEDNEDKPFNPFRAPKQLKTDLPPRAKKPHNKVSKKPSVYFGQGKTRAEIVKIIAQIAKECRPIGRVKAILRSPNREREHMITLTIQDKDRMSDATFIKLLTGQINHGKKGGKESTISSKVAMNCGIYAVPISKKIPWMSLSNIPPELIEDVKQGKKPQNRYYAAKFESWNVGYIRPVCRILGSIGEAGNLNVESLRILKMHDIWTDEYESEGHKLSDKVHESLRIFTKNIDPATGEWKIPEEELKLRVDLRKKRIFTIDPITAKDLDDALSIDKITDSIYEIGVHIADVSYFVTQGSELDLEAQLRCTSTYFVHKVYPMLPRLLCEKLCSLNPDVDRLSYSIFYRIDINTGEIDKSYIPKICRSVMRSCAKWNYQLVQDILDKKITSADQLEEQYRPKEQSFDEMVQDCFLMHEIAQQRRQRRFERGSIMMQNREFMFKLDPETQLPVSFVESKTRMPSKHLVEEYMLLANILVAEHLYRYCDSKTLLRVHPDLDKEKKEKLLEFFERAGMKGVLDLTNSKSVSQSLEALRLMGDSSKYNVAQRKFLTSLQCAKYMCINESQPDDYQHYGLNFNLYTHFTSPIRRYADLLVHRLVTLTLTHGERTRELIDTMDYSEYAEQCSEKSLNAKRASTQCTRLFHCLLLKAQGTRVYDTLLFDMDYNGVISIYIDEINMHHKVRVRDDPRIDSFKVFEEELILAAHINSAAQVQSQPFKHDQDRVSNGDRIDRLQQIRSYAQLIQEFAPQELIVFKIFDRVKVKVDTTTEFPLDIKCSLVLDQDDLEEYNRIAKEQEAANNLAEGAPKVQQAPKVQGSVVEIENLDADV